MINASSPVQALLVVDVQTGYVTGPEGVPGGPALLTGVAGLLDAARAAGALVVHVQNDGKPGDSDAPGEAGWALHLDVLPGEPVVRKTRADAFEGTELASLLAGIEDVAVCGVMSDVCVSATARAAVALGKRVVVPPQGHATQPIPPSEWFARGIDAEAAARAAEWALSVYCEISPDVAFTRR
ncbi:hypothetical protein Afil01_41810 [Actinorhabdospora filicis]|uniref:Isochorismatase-like domain-containing protein n=1 Tax=Actinorhabdospora filicis TaxID=1785913 RepID=A0A9W6SNZ9_9ACTN|nr:cysteine hydrolase family protein [Actinorhabdospora filicis]GLZ79374.1 hypothetical protein Afil01_41810 [Actinorhabdospora filicis]